MGEHRCAVASLWLGHTPSIGLAIGPRQFSGNFEQTAKVREFYPKYWKSQGILASS